MESDSTQVKIGNVILDYAKYSGEDLYSDGKIEDIILEACKRRKEEELLLHSTDWPVLYHLSSIRENIIEWFPMDKDTDVLEIGAGCGGITGVLSEKANSVTCIELSERRSYINAYRHREKDNIRILLGNFQDIEPGLGKYDCVTLIGVLEYSMLYIKCGNPFLEMLKIAKKHLKSNGKLFLAIENKMGLKYWNGAPEDHTDRLFSGLNDYIDNEKVRTFSKNEIEELLGKAGYKKKDFYFPSPDYKLPGAIYSDNYLPRPGDVRTYKKEYAGLRVYNFYEDIVSDQLCADGVFTYMSNSFVVIAGNDTETNIIFSKYNRERRPEYRLATYIENRGQEKIVIKKALCEEAQNNIKAIKKHELEWKGILPNVLCIEGRITDKGYESRYIKGFGLDELMYAYRTDLERFIEKTRFYIKKYFTPEEDTLIPFKVTDQFINVFGKEYPDRAESMRITNIDALFSNMKLGEDCKVYAFDYEWVFDFPVPYKYVIWRAAKEIYYQYQAYLKQKISQEQFLERIGFEKTEIAIYRKMEESFAFFVYGADRCEKYTSHYVKRSVMQEIRFC